MNEYDSNKMADVLRVAHGMEQTNDPAEADIILFNTCSVREKAQEKVFHDLGRVRHLKASNPHLLIGVGGCVASQEGKTIVSRAPFVDMVFGPQTLHRLPQLIAARKATGRAQVDISFPEIEKFDHLPLARTEGVTAFVSIMEGCSKYCSFCVVPYTRGEEVSRPLDDILTEIAVLTDQGIKEITLLGQNVNAYLGVMDDGAIADFSLLLECVHEIPGIERIRYTTSHPKEFTTRLIAAYSKLPKLVSHLHLPVQSGSDSILAAMKRGYTVSEYKSIIHRVRAIRSNISLTSDFIIGFPGETDADFEATMQLVEEMNFDESFSFIYSARPGTPAADLPDNTPYAVKLERLQHLQAKINQQAQRISRQMVGTTQRVLMEGVSKRNAAEFRGRTDNNRMVNLAVDPELIGCFVNIKITDARSHSLRGEIVSD
ncbi:tRNA-i(6)A37 thiotransferase enzyme MiaB [Nitrosomonas cryotolerans]|nr:tRNA-i(6)A37 thiotransferase enzyme MiaB [Nitrosomonas cryotolerans]